ncbi:MAG TPA: ferric reductase-like transmembrane domain-containing protein [Pseudonocardia sp.]
MTQALWFTSRSSGLVTLLLLTAVMVLGALHTGRATTPFWSRFAMHALHRNIALLALAFLTVHVATAIIDPYAGIRWLDAVVPFASSYHPFWTGLGATAADLLVALVVTSLVRTRIPWKAWRGLHGAAYGLWPVALVHGWGIGGVDSARGWVLTVDGVCVVAVVVAVVLRALARHPDTEARQTGAELR